MLNSSAFKDVWGLLSSGEEFRFFLNKDRNFELWDLQSASRLILRTDLGEGDVQMLYEASRNGKARELGELCRRTRLLKTEDQVWRRLFRIDDLDDHYHQITNKLLQRVVMPEVPLSEMRRYFYKCIQGAHFGGLYRAYWTGDVIPSSHFYGYDNFDASPTPKRFHIWKESFIVRGDPAYKDSWASMCLEEARNFTETPLPWRRRVFSNEELIYLDMRVSLPSPASPDQEPFFYEAPEKS